MKRLAHGLFYVWHAPSSCNKLNFDAAIFFPNAASDSGVVIQNHLGEVMAARSLRGAATSNSDKVEPLVWICISLIRWSKVITLVLWTLFCLLDFSGLDLIMCFLSRLHWFLVSRFFWDANSMAYGLTHYAKRISSYVFWLEGSPPPAMEDLYYDLAHLPL